MKPTHKISVFLIVSIFQLLFGWKGMAQGIPNLGQTDRWMQGALAAIERKDYQTANELFRSLIESGLPLPEEMPYYFAETLFELGQFNNSKNFLDKYLEITGQTGQNLQGAKELKQKLTKPLAEISACGLCDSKGYRYEVCATCMGQKKQEQTCDYCKGKTIVGCSKCAATGMIKKINVFNQVEIFECERCNAKGRLTCPECQGTGKQVSECKTCLGAGRVTGEVLCDHHEHEEQEKK